jgi:hypothetical protein
MNYLNPPETGLKAAENIGTAGHASRGHRIRDVSIGKRNREDFHKKVYNSPIIRYYYYRGNVHFFGNSSKSRSIIQRLRGPVLDCQAGNDA